jgi:hypothetical protein
VFGRARPQQSDGQPLGSSSKDSERTTSYPQGQDGKAPVVGALRTTSYKSSIQCDDRGYVTIN